MTDCLRPLTKDELAELVTVIDDFGAALPGWWWSIGRCHLSNDASCGPSSIGPDAHLLVYKLFDEGFHCDDQDPDSTPATSLQNVMDQAIKAKATFERDGL